MGSMRVVSLVPSATETLCAVGGRSLLVGRSGECDWPPGIEGLPVVAGPKLPEAGSGAAGSGPREIDEHVKGEMAGGGSLYALDTRLLGELRPDVILTQDLCGVCSIDAGSVRAAVGGMDPRPRVLSLDPTTFEDVLDDVLRVGEAVGMEREATGVMAGLRERMSRAENFVNPYADGARVAVLEWTDPLYVAGHWTPQLVERAGGQHDLNPTIAAEGSGAAVGPQRAYRKAGKSVRVPAEILAASSPEALVVCPCGVGLAGAMEMTRALAREKWWGELPAVRAGRVAVVDGKQGFSRPGPRLVDCFEWLVGWLNGRAELIPGGFAWESFDERGARAAGR